MPSPIEPARLLLPLGVACNRRRPSWGPVQRTWLAFIIAMLATLFLPAVAAANIITLSGPGPIPLSEVVEVLEDPSGVSTLEDVRSTKLSSAFTSGWKGRGFGSGSYWLRLRLHNPLDEPATRWLDTGSRLLSRADLYVLMPGTSPSNISTGSFHRYGERPVKATTFVLPLDLPARQTAEAYLRLQSTDSAPVVVAPKLWAPDQLQQRIDDERFSWATYVGIGLGLFVVNLLVFLQLRDLNYLLYALALLSGLWALSSMAGGNGAAYERLWPNSPQWERAAWLLSGPVFMIFMSAFLVHLTRSPTLSLRGAWPIGAFCAVYVLAVSSQLLGGLANLHPATLKWGWRVGETVFVPLQVALIWWVARAAVRGVRAARVILLGTLLPLIAAAYGGWTFIQSGEVDYGLIFPMFMGEWIVMAYALADRFRQMGLEREKAQADLVSGLQQSEAELERKVVERTQELSSEKERSQALLNNILPLSIAQELQATGSTRPQRHEQATVLFTDFSGFTQAAAAMPADRMVAELNAVFAAFDDLCDEEGVEKIKTIGDAYMAVAGVPAEVDDHAQRSVRLALKMVAYVEARNAQSSFKWALRVGLHSGPVVSGVVGKRKYAFDVWGDTVNIAARMEAASEPGRVNVSAFTWDLVRGEFEGEYRGKLQAKGKGEVDMYFVTRGLA